jgi:RNA polymerase sigma factor (sigma-70 family)
MSNTTSSEQLVDHLFRHEAGRMIAVLSRIFGIHNLELAEDVVQEAFLKAMQTWKFENIPNNPAGWLMQTARNKAIDIIRRQQNFKQLSGEVSRQLEYETEHTVQQFFSENEIADSQLQMIFACCHPSLKQEDQVALTLKTVSGFGVAEISRALLTNESSVQKRLYRAKQFIKENQVQLEIPGGRELQSRLDTVYTVLYLLFNEGYNSLKADELIRKDLCMEAMRLCLLLTQHELAQMPAAFGLLSLMCFQSSRFESRLDENNSIILLEEQDRSKWDRQLINLGYFYLEKSSRGDQLTVYHIESAIAAEHCMAPTFEETNWKRMLKLYDLLMEKKRTPVVVLNRAVVLAQLGHADIALREILQINDIERLLQTQYMYNAVLGDLYLKMNDYDNAKKYLNKAFQLTTSQAEKKLIGEKLTLVYNS